MAYAQKEYDSLLKEGKVWTMSYKATLNPEVYPDLYHYSKMIAILRQSAQILDILK